MRDVTNLAERMTRSAAPPEQTWDMEGLYATVSHWEADLERVDTLIPAVARYKGRLGDGPDALLGFLRASDELTQVVRKVSWYASNKLSEDQGDPSRQNLQDRAQAAGARAQAALSFFRPELLALPDATVESCLQAEKGLAVYRLYLSDILAEKEHLLSAEGEAIIAQLSEVTQAPYAIWQNTTAADIKFEPVTDEKGNVVPMSLSALARLSQSPERGVRKAAFESAAKAFDAHKRTIAATFTASQKRDAIMARLRKYPNSLAAALGPVHLPEELFHNLLKVAEDGSVHFRRYMAFRAKEMDVQQLAPWDLNAPLDHDLDSDITFADAYGMVTRALEPLGPEYRAVLDRAYQERWVDWADNQGKASGAYSSGCYGYHPIILLNWQGKIGDAFVLAHELGHAVHSTFSAATQPYIYSGYTLFLAEMASTTNELLLSRYLLDTTTNRALRRYVLTRALGAFTSNFFLGSMMAAFQLEVHEAADQGTPLTYESITNSYTSILKRFYGDTVEVTPEGMGATWMRAPHHFYNFYSYQYATGISAAAAFADSILNGGAPAVERYLNFLRAGSSAHSIDILKAAGVDMATPAPMEKAVEVFAGLVTELENA